MAGEEKSALARLRKREYARQWASRNPDKIRAARLKEKEKRRATRRAYYLANRDRILAGQKLAYANRGPVYSRHLRRAYGLSLADLERLIRGQGGACAICRVELIEPVVDHEHLSGLIRGALCLQCNSGIGFFKDDPEKMLAAIAYLANPPGPSILGPRPQQLTIESAA